MKMTNEATTAYRFGRLIGATERLSQTLEMLGQRFGGTDKAGNKRMFMGSLRTLPEARLALEESKTANRAGRRREAKRQRVMR